MNDSNNPLMRLLGSSKAIVVLGLIALTYASLYFGKVQWGEAKSFLEWIVTSWILGQSAEDAAKHIAAGKKTSNTQETTVVMTPSKAPPPGTP